MYFNTENTDVHLYGDLQYIIGFAAANDYGQLYRLDLASKILDPISHQFDLR